MIFNKKKPDPNERRRPRRDTESKAKPKFVSYYASRQVSEPSSAPKRLRPNIADVNKFRWRHVPYAFAGIAIAVCLLYTTMLSSNAKLLKVNRDMNLLRDLPVYQDAADKILSGSIWNKNKLTIDTSKFESEMKQQFPELSRAAISLPLVGNRPVIELISEKPVLFLSSGSKLFVVDKSGKAMASVNDIKGAGDLNLPTIRDEANIKIDAGKGALSSQDVTFITTLIKQYDSQKLKISSLTMPPLAAELHVKTDGLNYYVKYNLLTDPRVATGQYFAIKKKLDKDGTTPAEYIDSRVEEKIYYK